MTQQRPGANPFLAGLAGRCPNCGEGALFEGFLTVSPRCEACGFDLTKADSGDGPAVFVIFLGGFVGAFGILFTEIFYRPPIWVHFLVWLPVTALSAMSVTTTHWAANW